jgi:hypothetical protein
MARRRCRPGEPVRYDVWAVAVVHTAWTCTKCGRASDGLKKHPLQYVCSCTQSKVSQETTATCLPGGAGRRRPDAGYDIAGSDSRKQCGKSPESRQKHAHPNKMVFLSTETTRKQTHPNKVAFLTAETVRKYAHPNEVAVLSPDGRIFQFMFLQCCWEPWEDLPMKREREKEEYSK